MGKDSLIKSTAKKSAKKEEKVKKTTARKKTAKKETPKKSTKTPAKVKKTTVKVIETAGIGYHEDVQQAVQEANLIGPVLIISADLPLVNGDLLDEIIGKYEQQSKPALTVMIPEEAFQKYGLSAVSLYEHEGKMYAVSGINIIDGQRILEEQEQEVIESSRPEAVFTVNALKDLEEAKKFLLRTKEEQE